MHCRLCLSKCSPSHKISKLFSIDCEVNWINLIRTYLRIEITKNDAYTVICEECSRQLKDFHCFAQKVKNCQIKLKDIQENNKDSSFMIAEYLDELLRDEQNDEKSEENIKEISTHGSKNESINTNTLLSSKTCRKENFAKSDTPPIVATKNRKCSLCSKTYKTKSSFQTHMNTFHRVLTCKGCGLKFKLKRELRQHLGKNEKCLHKERATITEEVLVCEHCNDIFKTNVTLKTHIRTCHWDIANTTLYCLHCGKEFHFKETLDYHLQLDPICSQIDGSKNDTQPFNEKQTFSEIF